MGQQHDVAVRVRSEKDSFDSFRPYDHQIHANSALTKHYAKHERGVLIIPTGGGKTETATRWVLRNHVARGGRVLWLAHRRSLLAQAFATFHRAARDAGSDPDVQRETLSLFLVSQEDGRWSSVRPDHDVVFATSQSSSSVGSLGFVSAMAAQSEHPLFLIVDEAHHISANGYQKILQALGASPFRLLGLTATPVRMVERDNRKLWNSLGSVIFQIEKKELIEKGILSRPTTVTVETKIDFEQNFRPPDLRDFRTIPKSPQSALEA